MDGETTALTEMARTLLSLGTTAFLATTMTDEDSRLTKALMSVKDFRSKQQQGMMARDEKIKNPALSARGEVSMAECLGLHLEGPFIARQFAGAQNVDFIRAEGGRSDWLHCRR